MTVTRRHALQVLGTAACAAAVAPAVAEARAVKASNPDDIGLLFDATRCVGCRACATACRNANKTSATPASVNGGVYDAPLDLNGNTLTVIKQWDAGGKAGFVKAQCMHCADPACVSVCMMGALHKEARGVVAYDVERCVGCRYCQVACPFNVPRFQWESATPRIAKCELCRERPGNKGPACAEVCPRGAVITGRRTELLAEAKRRLAATPSAYQGGVYGETEVGGTACLYLSPVGFDALGLPRLGTEPAPALVETVQHGLYQGFIAPVALYGVLAIVTWKNHRSASAGEEDAP